MPYNCPNINFNYKTPSFILVSILYHSSHKTDSFILYVSFQKPHNWGAKRQTSTLRKSIRLSWQKFIKSKHISPCTFSFFIQCLRAFHVRTWVCGKNVLGKTVSGKIVPEEWSPGKKIPGQKIPWTMVLWKKGSRKNGPQGTNRRKKDPWKNGLPEKKSGIIMIGIHWNHDCQCGCSEIIYNICLSTLNIYIFLI